MKHWGAGNVPSRALTPLSDRSRRLLSSAAPNRFAPSATPRRLDETATLMPFGRDFFAAPARQLRQGDTSP
jgi:hypothetical protein